MGTPSLTRSRPSSSLSLSVSLSLSLQDVLDMRSNRWVPRQKAEGPKKIEDVHKEAAQQLAQQQQRDRDVSASASAPAPHWLCVPCV